MIYLKNRGELNQKLDTVLLVVRKGGAHLHVCNFSAVALCFRQTFLTSLLFAFRPPSLDKGKNKYSRQMSTRQSSQPLHRNLYIKSPPFLTSSMMLYLPIYILLSGFRWSSGCSVLMGGV